MGLPGRDNLSSYGGRMQNYSDPVDPTTDEEAEWRNKYAANVAAMTHTIPRAVRSFLGSTAGATAIADPSTGFIHDAVWGDSSIVKPSATYIATGMYDVIWPATVTDELDVTHTLTIRRAHASAETDGVWRDAKAKVTAANKVRVFTYQATGAAPNLDQLAGEVITVWIY